MSGCRGGSLYVWLLLLLVTYAKICAHVRLQNSHEHSLQQQSQEQAYRMHTLLRDRFVVDPIPLCMNILQECIWFSQSAGICAYVWTFFSSYIQYTSTTTWAHAQAFTYSNLITQTLQHTRCTNSAHKINPSQQCHQCGILRANHFIFKHTVAAVPSVSMKVASLRGSLPMATETVYIGPLSQYRPPPRKYAPKRVPSTCTRQSSGYGCKSFWNPAENSHVLKIQLGQPRARATYWKPISLGLTLSFSLLRCMCNAFALCVHGSRTRSPWQSERRDALILAELYILYTTHVSN